MGKGRRRRRNGHGRSNGVRRFVLRAIVLALWAGASASDGLPRGPYALFAPIAGTTAYLIDLEGTVVHGWPLPGAPGGSVYLLESGNLLATYSIAGRFQPSGIGGCVAELASDG